MHLGHARYLLDNWRPVPAPAVRAVRNGLAARLQDVPAERALTLTAGKEWSMSIEENKAVVGRWFTEFWGPCRDDAGQVGGVRRVAGLVVAFKNDHVAPHGRPFPSS